MAIVEMSKLKIVALSCDKDKILNELFKTRCVELKKTANIDGTAYNFCEEEYEKLQLLHNKIVNTIDFLDSIDGTKYEIIDLTAEQFAKDGKFNCKKILNQIDRLQQQISTLRRENEKLLTRSATYEPYLCLSEKFSEFRDTKHVEFYVGILPEGNIEKLDASLKDCPLTVVEICDKEGRVLKVCCHKSESILVARHLAELGFSRGPFTYDKTSKMLISECKNEIIRNNNLISTCERELKEFCKELPRLRLSADHIKFCLEKLGAENLVRSTKKTFVLEAYLPKDKIDFVDKRLAKSKICMEREFADIPKNEMPATLLKNNRLVKNFEFVTNMYSSPNYRELDPNGILMFFFSLFFGFVVADIGYGLVLVILGTFVGAMQKRESSFKQLCGVLATGGVFAIVFGVLFGTMFGVGNDSWDIVPPSIMPNPTKDVIAMLGICLGAGAVQIMVSLALKAVLLIRRKQYADAIFSALVWEGFFVGIGLVVLDMAGIVIGTKIIGMYLAIISVAISVVGLVITQKGINKLTRSFGAVYGIINIFSDSLSYARLFGLMLSGAIISGIVNQLATPFFENIATYLVGVIILAIGHGFNLVMGCLSAYIHVARLQYVEFFSRFYEGEGELFVPFGSGFSYVNITGNNI